MPSFIEVYRKQLGYLLSLPERTLRSLAAIAGGTSLLLTETLIPPSLKGSSLYKIFIGDVQKFLIEKVAQIQRSQPDGTSPSQLSDDYLRRKFVGGVLETAGLLAMQFSPLWVFAIAGDAAGGSKTFLNRLIGQLKRNGVVQEDAQVNDLIDLLDLLQFASRKTATAIDTPPLSRQELSRLANELKFAYGLMFVKTNSLIPRFNAVWDRMEQVSSQQDVSLEQIEGMMTIDLASWGARGLGSIQAVGQTGAELFGEKILDSYRATLDGLAKEGVENYMQRNTQPYLQAAAAHFDPDSPTWTESTLSSQPKKEAGDSSSAREGAQSDLNETPDVGGTRPAI
jgi:hypothetical protein